MGFGGMNNTILSNEVYKIAQKKCVFSLQGPGSSDSTCGHYPRFHTVSFIQVCGKYLRGVSGSLW